MPNFLKQIIGFIDKDIWRIRTKKLSPRRSFFIIHLRVLLLALREFQHNKCQISASALTFYTLLSIVPILAMAFGIARGFGFDKALQQVLLTKFPAQEELTLQIIDFANKLLQDAQGGIIAGFGVIVLFWTIVMVLNSIEDSFNNIWGIKESRSVGRKINDYLAIMLICPILVVITSAVTLYVTTQIQSIDLTFLGDLGKGVLFLLHIIPYMMVWILFTIIYIVMPNTKVQFISGLIGGIVAGTLYQIGQILYITFQIGVVKSNAVYGSFAALPLFLIWLQMSWWILLFGAEVSFAHQNVDTYEFEHDCSEVSHSFKRLLALQITNVVVKRFIAGQPPLTAMQIADSLDIPIHLVQVIVFDLTKAGIISALKDVAYKQSAYQPARDINAFTVQFVGDILNQQGTGDIPVKRTPELAKLEEIVKELEEESRHSSKNILLKDI